MDQAQKVSVMFVSFYLLVCLIVSPTSIRFSKTPTNHTLCRVCCFDMSTDFGSQLFVCRNTTEMEAAVAKLNEEESRELEKLDLYYKEMSNLFIPKFNRRAVATMVCGCVSVCASTLRSL